MWIDHSALLPVASASSAAGRGNRMQEAERESCRRLRARSLGCFGGYKSNQPVLKNINCGRPGQMVALLSDRRRQDDDHQPDPALLRCDGAVLIDGIDVRDDVREPAQPVGMCCKTRSGSDTVMNNIRQQAERETRKRSRRQTGRSRPFIERLPQGHRRCWRARRRFGQQRQLICYRPGGADEPERADSTRRHRRGHTHRAADPEGVRAARRGAPASSRTAEHDPQRELVMMLKDGDVIRDHTELLARARITTCT